MNLSNVERSARSADSGVHLALDARERDELLANVEYRASVGDPANASHYRRSLPDGTCLHLIITESEAHLHWDRHDPHGGPALLAAHLMEESSTQALSVVVAVSGLLNRITR